MRSDATTRTRKSQSSFSAIIMLLTTNALTTSDFPRTVFEAVLAKLLSRDDNSLGLLWENQVRKLRVSLSVNEATRMIDYRKRDSKRPPSFFHVIGIFALPTSNYSRVLDRKSVV